MTSTEEERTVVVQSVVDTFVKDEFTVVAPRTVASLTIFQCHYSL